jgi:hypothetical protein
MSSLFGIMTRLGLSALAVLALTGFCAGAARADEAAPIYDPGSISVIDLELPQASIEGLEDDPEGEYQPGTFSLATTDGTPDGIGSFSTPQAVEVRLKGSASFQDLSGKAAFKLKFPKAGPFLGLRKMTLNSMVEDPSMTHETLAYDAYRAVGVPSPRTGFAYLRLNGDDFGVYLNIENLDDVALAKIFGAFDKDAQHLYEGENGTDVKPELIADFEIDEGDEEDISDLEALVGAVNATDPAEWSTQVAPFADLAEMTRMWAVEKYAGQVDGYAGAVGVDHPNNYYLYSDPQGRFQMLPWGQDETWKEDNHLDFDGAAGLLFDKCLEDAACAVTYWEAVRSARDAIAGLDLGATATGTAALLAPWQELEEEESSRYEYDAEDIEEAVAETREFIATRPAEADEWLEENAPPAPPPPEDPPLAPPSAPEAAPSSTPATSLPSQADEPKGGFTVVQARIGRAGALRMRLRLRGPGVLVQRGTIATDNGPLGVCYHRVEVDRARQLTVSCPLSAGARERLRSQALRVTLVTRFRSANGAVERTTRTIVVPRS